MKQQMRRSQAIMLMNLQIERGYSEAKRLQQWSDKQINKEIEKLTHLKEAHKYIAEQRRKQEEQQNA